MPGYKVIVTDDRFNDYEEEKKVLSAIGSEIIICDCKSEDEVIKCAFEADGIMVNLAPLTARAIDSLRKCKVISRYGVGYDNVDVEACTKNGIQLTNVTDYCVEEVSDQALALMMACVRKVARRDKQVRDGMWNIAGKDPIYRIAGRTFAFLGFGMIARTLIRKIKGFNFKQILVYDPFVNEETINNEGAIKVGWEKALVEADFISIHMPLNEKTKGIIDKKAFGIMKPTAIIINTSRGLLIDETALIYALKNNKINSAGLDVHSLEPLNKDNPLLQFDNCVLTDHTGWYSEESIKELKRKAAENVRDVLTGNKVRYPVN